MLSFTLEATCRQAEDFLKLGALEVGSRLRIGVVKVHSPGLGFRVVKVSGSGLGLGVVKA